MSFKTHDPEPRPPPQTHLQLASYFFRTPLNHSSSPSPTMPSSVAKVAMSTVSSNAFLDRSDLPAFVDRRSVILGWYYRTSKSGSSHDKA